MSSIVRAAMEVIGTLTTMLFIGFAVAALFGGGGSLPLPAGDAALSSCTAIPMNVEGKKGDRL